MRILIVDDEPLILNGEAALIRQCAPEAQIESFCDPAEALRALVNPPPAAHRNRAEPPPPLTARRKKKANGRTRVRPPVFRHPVGRRQLPGFFSRRSLSYHAMRFATSRSKPRSTGR